MITYGSSKRIGIIALFISTMASVVHASEDDTIHLSIEGCDLDRTELLRLLTLELGQEVQPDREKIADFSIHLRCEAERVAIEARDPFSQNQLSRTLHIQAVPRADHERVVAITVSRLYMAAWLELVMPAGTKEKKMVQALVDLERGSAEDITVKAPEKSRDPWAMALGQGGRMRSLGDAPYVASYTELLFGVRLENGLGLMARAGFDFGNLSRTLGTIWLYTWCLGGDISRQWRSRGRMALDIGGAISAGYALFRGKSHQESVRGVEAGGFTGEAVVYAGPVLVSGQVHLALHLQAGYTIENPKGRIINEAPVTQGGFLAGAALRVFFFI